MTFTTCDLYDRFGDDARLPAPVFRDFGRRRQFCGVAVTVKCFEDNSRVKELLGTPGHGRVLVIDGGGSTRCALMGDMIARDAVVNGWEGVVIYGCVRDALVLSDLDLGVKALGATPRKSTRRDEGTVNVSIDVAGVTVSDGDVLFADADGILVLTAQQAEALSSLPH
jgi:regulator of ribonuclease activity A